MQGDPRIQLLDKVHIHLNVVSAEPSTKLDHTLLERCQTALSTEISHQYLIRLQGDAISALRALEEDPKPLIDLAVKAAVYITFSDVHSFLNLEDLIQGLKAPFPAISFLALIYLGKASDSPADAATVGSTPGLIEALVKLWLTTPETYISEKAVDVFCSLLATDLPYRSTFINKPEEDRVGNATGQGLVWRRLFHDKDVYEPLFALCKQQPQQALSKVQVSNAQGRLFDFVTRISAMNWDAAATPQLPEVERLFGAESLLDFAANKMIDQEDFLMLVTRFDFFAKLVRLKTMSKEACTGLSNVPTYSSPALEFLTSHGIHHEILKYYLDESAVDSITLSLMSNTHHRYIATYLRAYPEHFLQDERTVRSVIDTLNKNLNVRTTAWAHGTPPYADLWILEALPAQALLEASSRAQNPLLRVPTSPANAAAFHTLSSVFRGFSETAESLDFPATEHNDRHGQGNERGLTELQDARALFEDYITRHPEFWSNVGSATNILAMEDAAVAAVGLIRAIATASWSPVEEPSDEVSLEQTFRSGIAALITIGAQAFQALLLPPQPVAGAAGSDSSSAAWKITREKWDALKDIQRLMAAGVGKDEVPPEHWAAIGAGLDSRIALGPWGRSAGAGSRVQTLDA